MSEVTINGVTEFTCDDCGFIWLKGQSGSHDCRGRLAARSTRQKRIIELQKRDTAELRRELEAVKEALWGAERRVVNLETENASLKREAEELRRDGVRMDWLALHPGAVQFVAIKFGWMVSGDEVSVYPTLRAAIDAAINQREK